MGLLRYLVFFLLPFSFGFPSQNSKKQSERNFLSSDHSVLPTSKSILDFGCVQNEHFSFCFGHCQHNCSNLGLHLSCSKNCFSGCICDEGYVRGPRNDCVLVEECSSNEHKETFDVEGLITNIPLKCPEKENYSLCNAHCQSSCSTLMNPVPCSVECIPGCVCNDGYVRDSDGKCIPVESCTFLKEESLEKKEEEDEDFCPPNEAFSPCLAHCQKSCTNWRDFTVSCLKICVPGCICDNGLVRSHYGNCIQPRKCLTSNNFHHLSGDTFVDCPIDEHFDRCKAHCQKSCSNWDQEIKCREICVPGCVCDKDFVRSHSGKCVLSEKCSLMDQKPKISNKKKSIISCPAGEQRSSLKPLMNSDLYCISGNNTIEICPPTFLKGCVCKKGQIRGKDNHCIDHRLIPNVNEIHFLSNVKSHPVSLEINSKLEPTKEISGLSESTKSSTSFPYTVLDVENNVRSNTEDGLSTTTAQHATVTTSTIKHNLINTPSSSLKYHGCPNRQKCFEWCQVEGFQKGACMGARKLNCVCFYF